MDASQDIMSIRINERWSYKHCDGAVNGMKRKYLTVELCNTFMK